MALAIYPIITPIMSRVTFPLTFCATKAISAIIRSEPMIAERVIVTSPITPSLLRATPPMLPESKTTQATPRLAPELIPSTDGPARGLRNTVCIRRPLTASPAPAIIAVRDCGNLDLRIILRHIKLSLSLPNRISIMLSTGMLTEPKRRFRMKNPTMEIPSITIRMIVLPLLISKGDNIAVYDSAEHQDGIRG